MRYNNGLNRLLSEYKKKRYSIKKRLKEFRNLYRANYRDIFRELCFCILTPQSNAVYCDRAIRELVRSGLLFKGSKCGIKARLRNVRFPNNKASYLIAARQIFENGKTFGIKNMLDTNDVFKTREQLVKNIKGLGYKEASHFLRNIGLGRDMAILDVHILKNLRKFRVIRDIPPSINKNTYLNIENRMRAFSQKINIPLEELDLLFWSNQTGFIFK